MTPPEAAITMIDEPLEDALGAEDETPDAERFWADRSDEALVSACDEKESDWWDYAQNHGFVDMWLAMIAEYYGQDPTTLAGFDAAQVDFDGDDAELVRFRVAELRVYVRQAINSTTKERPAFKAAALNQSHAAMGEVSVVDTIVNSLYDRFMGDKRERRLVERGELLARSYTWCRWDQDGGDRSVTDVMIPPGTPLPDGTMSVEPIPSGEQQEVMSGAPLLRIKCPWEVVEDPTVDDDDDHEWRIVRERRSKWELFNAYPDKRAEIEGASVDTETAYELLFAFDTDLPRTDDVIVKHLYVPPCPSMPEGHYAIMCGGAVLERMPWMEAPVAGDYIPLKPYEPSEMLGCSFGYSESWDQLVIQQMMTQVFSDIATNITALGRQFIMLPQGSEISPEMLANGTFAAYVPDDQVGKISAPNLAQIGTGAQWFVAALQKEIQLLSGENSVSMGDPSENIKSGTMAALFHAIAMERKGDRQAALNNHRREVATMLVDFVRKYGQGEMLAETVGPDEAPKLTFFQPNQLEGVRRVTIETTNPMLMSRSGQMEIAQYLKDIPGAVTTPSQAIQAITTGQVKPLFRAPESELALIQWENEQLRKGPQVQITEEPEMDPVTGEPTGGVVTLQSVPEVPVFVTHNPQKHLAEHTVVAHDPHASPEARKAAQAHILEHHRVMTTIPPDLGMMLGFNMPVPQLAPGGGGKPPKAAEESTNELEAAGQPKPAKPPKGAAVSEA